MSTLTYNNRTFDARPDRIDLQDRVYQPKLVSLPARYPDIESIESHLPIYAKHFVLDQGEEGACTGFGLAAVINYLQWRNNDFDVRNLNIVSPRMLYHLAQLYDEWAGEDYVGSSCRGGMKGWHRHGVCTDRLWPYRNHAGEIVFVSPKAHWEQDAASRPLGAYYRIDKCSINDLQAAIYEVGAVYCSANVHSGWYLDKHDRLQTIQYDPVNIGGHAFAIVGYTEEGFIVQNSWGREWGYHGFALLTYEDWIRNGNDSWVAVMGAPMCMSSAPITFSTRSLRDSAVFKSGLAHKSKEPGAGFHYNNQNVHPLTENEAYRHTLVLGNNGVPIHRIVSAENAYAAAEEVCVNWPQAWLNEQPMTRPRKLAIYVHGGLNSENDSIMRIRMMAPYFRENGIFPLFITWKTGPMESISGILDDSIRKIFSGSSQMRQEGIIEKIKEATAEMRDRSIEVACENLLVKPMWSEMKQNAASAAEPGAGLELLAAHLLSLKQKVKNLEIHLAGHSAGAIVLGHLLSLMDKSLAVSTLTLFAPACTIGFANQHYGSALQNKQLSPDNIHIDIMDDERERADTVGPYGKSLLYLISRALESRHKMPLLGMEWAWNTAAAPQDQWSEDPGIEAALTKWSSLTAGISLRLHTKQREDVYTGSGTIKLAHGSFDNDIEVVADMLERMRGETLIAGVENLAY
ncbi:C1 family peptidase [Sulfuricurvum sp. RIFCSPLOWO2_12_FULL_43_24]|uniref:C1 family peptidase n=1 Tax=Sulfuricurvum sp. RIFCSPLOWO2_12_FULL_43_24 TaxID=1802247 RepID=UPI0008AAFD02|nr:C1 family peptidase [Sulfuricurvum sp. RIFCSPLOWO2_12_FULL_43_24]OHD89210.1 MAG: peptidase C1 [Sulfuricurvum sp. RIFCSPLOWO2_12_FULL_43_24]